MEWALVSALLTLLLLAVLQIGFAMHIRVTLVDAAAEGARYAGLRDATPAEAIAHTEALIDAAVGEGYADRVVTEQHGGHVVVRIQAPLPLIGPLGIPGTLEVQASAPIE